jgi:hypothetical protein
MQWTRAGSSGSAVLGTLALAVVLTGCGGSSHNVARAGPSPTAPSATSTSSTDSPTPSAGEAPTPSANRDAGRTVTVASSRDGAAFVSPSGNISCEILGVADPRRSAQARCDVVQHTYPQPHRPASCPLDYGSSFELDQRASILCAGDTVAYEAAVPGDGSVDVTTWFDPARDPVVRRPGGTGKQVRLAALRYGDTIAYRNLTCSSARTGVTCRNTRTGAAFTVARASYHLR